MGALGATYGAELGVVVPGKGVKCSHLHPAPAQLLRRVLKEPTDVSANLKHGAKQDINEDKGAETNQH